MEGLYPCWRLVSPLPRVEGPHAARLLTGVDASSGSQGHRLNVDRRVEPTYEVFFTRLGHPDLQPLDPHLDILQLGVKRVAGQDDKYMWCSQPATLRPARGPSL